MRVGLLTLALTLLPICKALCIEHPEQTEGAVPMLSQDAEPTTLYYILTGEAAVGSGEYTAYQLVSNRHHVLSTRANTGYMRAALIGQKSIGKSGDWQLSGALDMIASAHADHRLYLQQLYGRLAWRNFYLEAGAREYRPVLRDMELSSGSLIQSGNAKPVPQLRIGTEGFWTIPGLKNWLQTYFDACYGHFVDDGWLEGQYETFRAQLGNRHYVTTDVWLHQKKLYLRTDPNRRLSFTIGMEHSVQFGGRNRDYVEGKERITTIHPTLGDFFKVILPLGEGNVGTTNDKHVEWVKGNHLGEWSLQFDYRIARSHKVKLYLEVPFEDGSGIRKGNGMDGLWGIEYRNCKNTRTALRALTIEYLRTTDQSGPIHWSPDDFSATGQKLPPSSTGNDNYYNNYMYNGYCHYGMSMGTPLLKSPIYNRDAYLGFVDNRVQAYHVGISGDITERLRYLVRGSWREGMGTYFVPLTERSHSLDIMSRLSYWQGPWRLAGAVGYTRGNIYGDCMTLNFSIAYHGKII